MNGKRYSARGRRLAGSGQVAAPIPLAPRLVRQGIRRRRGSKSLPASQGGYRG